MPHIGYKLTDKHDCTRGNTQWGPGVTHTAAGKGELCGPGWIHLYDSPEIAAIRDRADGNFGASAHLWRVEWEGNTRDERGLKRGARRVTTIERMEPIRLTRAQRVRAAIYCAQAVLSRGKYPEWWKWAEGWLAGKRGRAAAYAAYAAAAAAYDAYATAYAAYAAAAYAAYAAAYAAYAYAASPAADAADAAAAAGKYDLTAIVRRAITDEPRD